MSLVPAFEIGIWNAWMFVPAFCFFHGVAVVVWLLVGYDLKSVLKKASGYPYNDVERRIKRVWFLVFRLLAAATGDSVVLCRPCCFPVWTCCL